LLTAGLSVIIFVLIMDLIVMPVYTNQGEELELPDLTELHFQHARKILEEKGFQIILDGFQFDDTYPESTVVQQNPFPFTKIKRNRRIYVTLSAGEQLIQVPRIIGSSERDAEFRLKQLDLNIGEIFFEYNNYHPEGVVCGQSIPSGTEVRKETKVDIIISNGRLPDAFIVPDVVGYSLSEGKRKIRNAGLKVGEIIYEAQKNLLPDTILMQSIPGGEDVKQDTQIDLIVSELEKSLT
jgi:serine/threonine-protein kinase